ncbi:unnamed protein product [Pocillopora meandrina]|uniref:Uncharacterized protein n=1 Tax=Pocillopora meandrina TaxID=46732 RepID=A0AAU9XR32_9CNID|nr:unnamed protein product [Pocillopora meandrina]
MLLNVFLINSHGSLPTWSVFLNRIGPVLLVRPKFFPATLSKSSSRNILHFPIEINEFHSYENNSACKDLIGEFFCTCQLGFTGK